MNIIHLTVKIKVKFKQTKLFFYANFMFEISLTCNKKIIKNEN